jgi:glycosyltransferase involved in cell wall biosynthesis
VQTQLIPLDQIPKPGLRAYRQTGSLTVGASPSAGIRTRPAERADYGETSTMPQNPRLLIVTTEERFLRAFLLPFATYFRSLGWQVDALASGVSDSKDCEVAFDHVFEAGWTRRLGSLENFVSARAVRKLVAEQRYDLVHLHTPIAAFVGRYALRRTQGRNGPAVIYTAHGFHFHSGGSLLSNALFRAAEKLAGRWTDYLVTINDEDFRSALGASIVPADRLRLIRGIGIDTRQYDPARTGSAEIDRIRTELGLARDDRLVLMIGRLEASKRHEVALRALAGLDRPGVHLAFAGDGPRLLELRKLATDLGVDRSVHFLDNRSDIPALILASKFTITTSEREGLSRSVLESMSLGVPVVGTAIRGVRDLVGNDKCGLLVEVGDAPGLAAAMRRLLDNGGLAAALGRSARQRASDFELSLVLEAYHQLYSLALSR